MFPSKQHGHIMKLTKKYINEKSLLFTLILFSLLQFNKAQQIGNGWATVINDFTALLNSGAYSAADPIGSNPVGSWQHLFVIRHPNPNNNYQFQLSSSLYQDDRLFFRKLSFSDLSSGNQPWYELATRVAILFWVANYKWENSLAFSPEKFYRRPQRRSNTNVNPIMG
jgi:hypothetical protein